MIPFAAADPPVARRVLDAFRRTSGRAERTDLHVFSVESVGPITYPWEWPNQLLKAAGLLTLRLREMLLSVGLDMKDASAFNVQFRGSNPMMIDVGSIEMWRPNPSWNATRQYVEHFVNPLAVGSGKHLCAAEAWELSLRKGLPSDTARAVMPRRQRWRPSLWVLQTSTRPIDGQLPVETKYGQSAVRNPELALKATLSLTRRLRRLTEKLGGSKHTTTWNDYGLREHYTEDELSRKLSMSREFVSQGDGAELVLDVGGNDGLVARDLVSQEGGSVIVLDADPGALDVLCSRLIGAESLSGKVTPIYADILNLTASSGLLYSQYAAFTERIRPTAVLCQSVLHHVVITQAVPMRLAIEALASFGAPLLVEFATEEDPKVELLLRQVPTWSGEYSLNSLLDALNRSFDDVKVAGQTLETRIVVTTGSPKV